MQTMLLNSQKTGKKNLNYFLYKWFCSDFRNRKTTVLFVIFMILALTIALFSDLPKNKENAALNSIYKVNMLFARTYDNTKWNDKYNDKYLTECVLSYGQSCPDGNEHLNPDDIMRELPEYEISLNTIPYNKEAFKLSDRIKYGSYYTDKNQIILSYEMATALYPGKPEKMLGEKINLNVYSMGNVEFEIVGIFDNFTETEKKYLQALDIHIASGNEYVADDYAKLFFVNSLFTEQYEDNETFYSGKNAQRGYYLYFDSYESMKCYYESHNEEFREKYNIYLEDCSAFLGLKDSFFMIFYVTLPLSIFLCLFTIMFYVAVKKNEFMYNNRFIAVFEYSGYDKKKVINRFILLNIVDTIKIFGISLGVTMLITIVINVINSHIHFVNFVIFTYNIYMIIAFIVFLLMVTTIITCIMLKQVKVKSWYENLIESRDLI